MTDQRKGLPVAEIPALDVTAASDGFDEWWAEQNGGEIQIIVGHVEPHARASWNAGRTASRAETERLKGEIEFIKSEWAEDSASFKVLTTRLQAESTQKDEEIAINNISDEILGELLGSPECTWYDAIIALKDRAEAAESELAALKSSSAQVRKDALREAVIAMQSARCENVTRKDEGIMTKAILSLLAAPDEGKQS
jgi:hypothetical protein